MSPLLFAIFVSSLGAELNKSGLGITLSSIIISSIFFADDIILIARSSKGLESLMEITKKFCKTHHLDISEKKSKVMTHDAATGKMKFKNADDTDSLTLESVISFKNLGMYLNSSSYGLFKDFNNQARVKANNYLHSVLSLVRSGPDRSQLAYSLWTQCAIPSILYGCEILPFTQATLDEIERVQTIVGKFILQIPRNSTNVCTNIDGGLRPVWSAVAEKVLLYAHNTMKKPSSNWAKLAMDDNLKLGCQSPYTRNLIKWKEATNSFGKTPDQIKECVKQSAIKDVLEKQSVNCVSSFALSTPGPSSENSWFKPKKWVNDSGFCKIYSEFRSCNSGLGNRGPCKDGRFFKLCPLCHKDGLVALNNEVRFYLNPYILYNFVFI